MRFSFFWSGFFIFFSVFIFALIMRELDPLSKEKGLIHMCLALMAVSFVFLIISIAKEENNN